jgi:hypothetical protein
MFRWLQYYPHVQVSLPWMTNAKDVSVYLRLDIVPANGLKSRKDLDSDPPAKMTSAFHDNVVSHHRNGPVVYYKPSSW